MIDSDGAAAARPGAIDLPAVLAQARTPELDEVSATPLTPCWEGAPTCMCTRLTPIACC